MTARARRVPVSVAAIAITAALLAGCASSPSGVNSGGGSSPGLSAAVDQIPHRSAAAAPQARLARGLIPPTNRWFSGLVFGTTPQPVFPLPLSFSLTPTGFAFGVPKVATGADTIAGPFTPAVRVDMAAKSSEITAYDAGSVTIEQKAGDGSALGAEVIAEGSPTVSFTALKAVTLSVAQPFAATAPNAYGETFAGSSYGLVTLGRVSATSLHLAAGQTATWFAVPAGSSVAKLAPSISPLKSVSLGYSVVNSKASTSLTYHASGNTLIVALPHQFAALRSPSSCSLGTYPSVYGTLSLCAGPTLSWTSPRLTPSDSLDLSRLGAADTSRLRTQLASDVGASPPIPADGYYGGKALYRLANLVSLGHELGARDSAASAQRKLTAGLELWTDPRGCATRIARCFVYDPAVKGIVALQASFGSEQFNDHDFHYGYFLYAASVAVRYEPSLLHRIKPVIDLLAADIATPARSGSFPDRRGFDAYAGHSWASGYSPFADGNNQESSSEAVDAWNGLALWAAATRNQPLATEATWMLSAEAASAKAYWTNFNTSESVYKGFAHSVVGIEWGAKRDYATWFSAAPSAKLGIQLIPMSPASTYLAGDSARIARNVSESTPTGYSVSLGDYLLMYSALGGRSAAASALKTARGLPDRSIDDADSRSYLLAWMMVREHSGP